MAVRQAKAEFRSQPNVAADKDTAPTLVMQWLFDKITAMAGAQAVAAALFARSMNRGLGQHVSLNMLDTAIWFMWPDVFEDHVWQSKPECDTYNSRVQMATKYPCQKDALQSGNETGQPPRYSSHRCSEREDTELPVGLRVSKPNRWESASEDQVHRATRKINPAQSRKGNRTLFESFAGPVPSSIPTTANAVGNPAVARCRSLRRHAVFGSFR